MGTLKNLLANADLREEFGLGRDLATALSVLLPHVRIGRTGRGERRLVRRDDVQRLMDRAAAERVDLWALVHAHTPDTLAAWLDGAH